MKRVDFVKKIVELYKNNAQICSQHTNVVRGRGRTISSEVEDLFGIYISELLGSGYKIYVDIRISVNKEVFFPDIAICKGNKILQMWDLKMDLGWMRGKLFGCIDNNKALIERIKGRNLDPNVTLLGGYRFADDVTYNFAIITLCNGGTAAHKVFEYANEQKLESGDVSSAVFYIFKHRDIKKTNVNFNHDDYHPNSDDKYKNDKDVEMEHDWEWKIKHGMFEQLDRFILSLRT